MDLSRAVRATSLVTLGSRLGGLVRDVIVGRVFGVGYVGSAFQAAFAIPNMFRRLFGEGALSAAFIPAYTEADRESPARAAQLASLALTVLGLVTTGLTVLIELGLFAALVLLPRDPERDLSLKLVMVMLPFMPLICTVAIQAGMLQVHGRYGPAASGPVILNTFIVASGMYFVLSGERAGPATAYILGFATVASGMTQMAWFFWLLRPHVRWTRAWGEASPRARAMLRAFVPVAVGLGTLQLNTFLDTVIAMWPIWVGPTLLGREYPLDEESNVILSLTARLYQFPLGVFGVSIASAVFPLLARHSREPELFADTLRRGVRLAVYIGLPATAGLILVRHDAVAVLYGHGSHGWAEPAIARAAAVLAGFAVGVWAYSVNQVLTRAMYARGDTSTPMRVSLAMIAVNIGLNLTLIWIPGLREAGLAWSTAISAVLQAAILWRLNTRSLGSTLIDAHATRAMVRVLAATGVMAVLVWAVVRWFPASQGVSAWGWKLARLLVGTGVGGVAYLALSWVLRVPELRWLLHRSPVPVEPEL